MTNHPITPPPELVQQWCRNWTHAHGEFGVYLATQAARWGADQELEACCDSLQELWAPSDWITSLRAKRRPKPPSLKEQALAALKRQSTRSIPSLKATEDCDTIRHALEQLDD